MDVRGSHAAAPQLHRLRCEVSPPHVIPGALEQCRLAPGTAIPHTCSRELGCGGGPRLHKVCARPIRAATAGVQEVGCFVRPTGGSVRYSLVARPTSRACFVGDSQQRIGYSVI